MLSQSVLFGQIRERAPHIHPVQIVTTIMGMIVLPFMGKPIFLAMAGGGETDFQKMMNDRKELIPKWIEMILSAEV
jgi:hypothetical protein